MAKPQSSFTDIALNREEQERKMSMQMAIEYSRNINLKDGSKNIRNYSEQHQIIYFQWNYVTQRIYKNWRKIP